MTAVDAPLAGADDAAVLAKFEEIFVAADKCPCCGDPLLGAVFDNDNEDGAS